jgi:hypothetical protein
VFARKAIAAIPDHEMLRCIGSDAPYCTGMNGFVAVLAATAPVLANQTNHIKLAIADGSDQIRIRTS